MKIYNYSGYKNYNNSKLVSLNKFKLFNFILSFKNYEN